MEILLGYNNDNYQVIMILRQTHQSPQKTIWKKLRLIRKCVFCRKEGERCATIWGNLKKWDHQANVSGQFISLTIINNSLNKINTEYNHANDSQTKSSNHQCHDFLENYCTKEKSKKQLHLLAYYYRYYGHKPTLVAPQMFSFMIQYRNKKKMLEYYRIQTLYSPQKSTKGSIKMKKNARMVQQFLNMIEQSKINLSRFSQAVAGEHQVQRKTLRQIDDEYNFMKSGQIHFDFDGKLSKDVIQKKKKSSTKTKKHHKSCDIIAGSEKKDNRNDKFEKKGLKKRKGILSQELQRHQKLQQCISKLKAQIKREKEQLKRGQTGIKTKKPKHKQKPQKDKSVKVLKK